MTSWQIFWSAWDPEPSIILGCAALLLGYFAALHFRFVSRSWYFLGGIATLVLALLSPLDMLSDTYLFSAHMLQHILLILVVPPLLILGIPEGVANAMTHLPMAVRFDAVLTRPLIAWTEGVGTMWIWHWPPLYNAALRHEPIHITEHLMFLFTATIFLWPVLHPVRALQLSPLSSVVYLFSACTAHTVLAILITFSPLGTYPAYLRPADPLNLLPLIRGSWGLTPAVDQQIGGLLMWVPVCWIYLALILARLVDWYRVPEHTVPVLSSGVNDGI
jgi:putative membrane protein